MRKYNFDLIIDNEEFLKGRTLIALPFNVWEVFGVKGNVTVKLLINENEFKVNLVPRGKGNYVFFLTSEMKKKLKVSKGTMLNISVELANNGLKNELYSEESKKQSEDYIKIQSISYVPQPTELMCGQACIAMLAGRNIEEVAKVMGTKGSTSIGQIIDALDHYKISHGEKNIRISKKNPNYSEISILTVHMPKYTHWVLHYKGKFYDPEFGVLDSCHPEGKITSFLEING